MKKDKEGTEIFDIDVDTVGLVPDGANKRNYILTKGGERMSEIEELAKAITSRPDFWSRVATAMASGDSELIEKADAVKAAVEMAVKILDTQKDKLPEEVQAVVEDLKAFLSGDSKTQDATPDAKTQDATPDQMPEENMARGDQEKELAAMLAEYAGIPVDEAQAALDNLKGGKENQSTEEPTEDFTNRLPDGAAEVFRTLTNQIEVLNRKVEESEARSRREKFTAMAERFAALPDVTVDGMVDILDKLESTDPELYNSLVPVLDNAASAMREVFGEVGTQRTGSGSAFEQRVEAKTQEILAGNPGKSYSEAYSEAFKYLSDSDPRAAEVYLASSRRNH